MNQAEKRRFLIEALLSEAPRYRDMEIPPAAQEQKNLLRALMNVRLPAPISGEFARVQDAYLQEAIREKGVTKLSDLTPLEPGIYLWQGDITTLACDAIVNAANAGMTGCYRPCHSCIDNCIHTYAGIQLRNTCAELMERQGHEEPTGQAKITPGYTLPCRYVLHTVGPIVDGRLTQRHCDLLASCYRSCLELAEENGVRSIAFCCISTGVFMFPKKKAAEIAVETVKAYLNMHAGIEKVVINVFADSDRHIYEAILNKKPLKQEKTEQTQ